jgi:hypothetical protein
MSVSRISPAKIAVDPCAWQDPDAQELERRYPLYESGAMGIEAFWEGLREGGRVKQTAVSLLRTLRARN